MAQRFIKIALLGLAVWSAAAAPAVAESKALSHGLYPEELISAKELRALQKKKSDFILFDARSPRSFEDGHIAGAVLPRSKDFYERTQLFEKGIVRTPPDQDEGLKEGVKDIPRDKAIVTYCNEHCSASSVLLFKLKGLGFKNVRSMEEGYQAWEAKEYPVVKRPK